MLRKKIAETIKDFKLRKRVLSHYEHHNKKKFKKKNPRSSKANIQRILLAWSIERSFRFGNLTTHKHFFFRL